MQTDVSVAEPFYIVEAWVLTRRDSGRVGGIRPRKLQIVDEASGSQPNADSLLKYVN